MKMTNRLDVLEGKAASPEPGLVHLITVRAHQSKEDAFAKYGTETVGPDDQLIFLIGVGGPSR